MIFTGYWKVLVLNFSVIGNTVFFESRSWWKDDIYWLLWSSCFELFVDGKYGFFSAKKSDGKIIFTWSFWAFYDIPGPGKFGFTHSVVAKLFAFASDVFFSRVTGFGFTDYIHLLCSDVVTYSPLKHVPMSNNSNTTSVP